MDIQIVRAHFNRCNAEQDSAQQTLEACPAFEAQRRALRVSIGPDLFPAAVVKALAARKEKWKAVSLFCEEVMTTKENAERAREISIAARTGRQRRRTQSGRRIRDETNPF
ncbi:unnamed protein product [Heterotrigona itama]|uniref:Uncharacterized protein n=1 Tax=Heterotrigona itama TaxID=395501 RepID=A0A6V7GX98_9HYME|nr:unnamed protein product [Heterotrigona itama]